jgi:hypothetical protein
MMLFGFGCAVGIAGTTLFFHFAVLTKLQDALRASEARVAEMVGRASRSPK